MLKYSVNKKYLIIRSGVMRKLVRNILYSAVMVMGIQPSYARETEVLVVKDNERLILQEGSAFQSEAVSYMSLRALADAFGVDIIWEKETGHTQLVLDDRTIVIRPSTQTYTLQPNEGVPIEGKVQTLTKEGALYIPIRAFTEMTGYMLSYIPEGPIVRVHTRPMTMSNEMIYKAYEAYIPENTQVLYLTFDDGPNQHTETILDLLEEADMHATFFMMDNNMKNYPETVKRMLAEGHTLALHGVTHDKNQFYRYTQSPLNEINQANATLEAITGVRTQVTRMPYGSVPYLTDGQQEALEGAGYEIWDWHVDSRDWANKNSQITYQQVLQQLENVSVEEPVLLFHDSIHTVGTVEQLIAWMDDNGWDSEGLAQTEEGLNFKSGNLYH